MWPPPDIQSLPSKEEIQSINEEISSIELEIIETELRLDNLRKSLFERRAWIAPMRRIPHEILSHIFTEASKNDWKAPLVLQSVSRRWRNVVVDSPKAWTFIPLSKCRSERPSQLISLFLERIRNTPLHVSVGDGSLLGDMEHLHSRIECIRLKLATRFILNRYLQRGYTFHRLERLEIWHWDSDALAADDPAAWDMSLFPNLKVLDITSRSPSLLKAISASPEFPAIRHLTVRCTRTLGLHDILTKSATSLESAELAYISRQPEELGTEHKIHFPCLRYLQLTDFSDEDGSRFRLKGATPNLQAYHHWGASTLNAVEVDTSSVILLFTIGTPDLSWYPRLVTLSFSGASGEGEEVIKAIECLRDNPALCPSLELIEYSKELTQEQLARAKNALMTREEVTRHIIQLTRGTWEAREERIQAFRGIEAVRFLSSMLVLLLTVRQCGDHMPCNFSN